MVNKTKSKAINKPIKKVKVLKKNSKKEVIKMAETKKKEAKKEIAKPAKVQKPVNVMTMADLQAAGKRIMEQKAAKRK